MVAGPTILPTLGLTKYKNADLQVNEVNPFKQHDRTEKMFILKEREREFQDFNKLEKDAMHLAEKGKNTRPARTGVIREIRNISSNSGARFEGNKTQQLATIPKKGVEQKKLNIFEDTDANKIKH